MNYQINWTGPIDPKVCKQIGLTGRGDIRYHNDCVYRREGEHWYELQVPPLPSLEMEISNNE